MFENVWMEKLNERYWKLNDSGFTKLINNKIKYWRIQIFHRNVWKCLNRNIERTLQKIKWLWLHKIENNNK